MKKRKYSNNFERDYNFYFNQRNTFTFAGSNIEEEFNIENSLQGKSAKECFFLLDSQGKKVPCCEYKELIEVLICKAAINLQIETWAQSRADFTLDLFELQEYLEYYKCPDWVGKAIERQRIKILRNKLYHS